MSIIAKYLCKEFFKLLIICELIFVSIYLIFRFFGKLDNFSEAHVSITRMLSYLLYGCPFVIVQMLPPATLIAVIIMFALMKKNNEIIALKACGVNVWQLSQPIIISSLLLAIAQFLFSETVVPYTSSRSHEIYRIEVEKQDPGRFYVRKHIWYRGANCIYWIRRFDNKNMVMKHPTFYFFDRSFRLVKRIDGRRGIWKKRSWKISNGIILEAKDHGDYSLSKFEQFDLELPETPETFAKEEKKPEEMGYWQLKRFAESLRLEGYDTRRYLVDLNIKLSFPFIILVMVLIGTPIALRQQKGGTPVAVSLGIAFCFIYFLVLGVSRSIGIAGVLPPVLSAWLANGVFFFLGIYLTMNVDR